MKDESMSYLDALKEIKRLKEALNKIRAEIKKESEVKTIQLHWGEAMGLNKAIDIFDKYRGDTDVFDKQRGNQDITE